MSHINTKDTKGSCQVAIEATRGTLNVHVMDAAGVFGVWDGRRADGRFGCRKAKQSCWQGDGVCGDETAARPQDARGEWTQS